jgi:putative hydrolase of the HAD superfamily
MDRLRAIFFDAAGTLFESREPIGEVYARIARQFGLDAPVEVVTAGFRHAFGSAPPLAFGPGRPPAEVRQLEREWWRERVAESFKGLGTFDDFDAYFDALFAHFADPANWGADPEAAPMLNRLKNSGLELGVISNFDFRVYRILDGLDLTRFFDSITISSEAGYAKPRREIFAAALARHGIEAAEAVHVGDSAHLDFEAAGAAGLGAVLLDPAFEGAPRISGRTARISSLASMNDVAQIFRFA